MNEDKFIRSASDAIDRWTDKQTDGPRFGGEPGTQVPEVDPEDLKAVWDYSAEVRESRGPNVAIGMGIFERLCKPGVDVQAVCYRASMISLVAGLIQNARARAQCRWHVGHEGLQSGCENTAGMDRNRSCERGFPFDVECFLQQCEPAHNCAVPTQAAIRAARSSRGGCCFSTYF